MFNATYLFGGGSVGLIITDINHNGVGSRPPWLPDSRRSWLIVDDDHV